MLQSQHEWYYESYDMIKVKNSFYDPRYGWLTFFDVGKNDNEGVISTRTKHP